MSVPTLLTVLALGACVSDKDGEVLQIQGALEEDVGAILGVEKSHAIETGASDLAYDDPICAQVRSTKDALNALDDPSKSRERGKRGRSRIVDTERTRGADGSRSDRLSVASGSGTPDEVRAGAEAAERFFDAERAAGGLQRATEICLRRSGTRNR